MHIRYDAEVDVLSIQFREAQVTTRPLGEGIVGEYDAQGQLVGIEILDAKKTLGEREHRCPCGFSAHRDHNAALVIQARGLRVGQLTEASGDPS